MADEKKTKAKPKKEGDIKAKHGAPILKIVIIVVIAVVLGIAAFWFVTKNLLLSGEKTPTSNHQADTSIVTEVDVPEPQETVPEESSADDIEVGEEEEPTSTDDVEPESAKPEKTVLFTFKESIVVNVFSSERHGTYLRVGISLEVDNEKIVAKLAEREPELRNVVITILTQLSAAELQGLAIRDEDGQTGMQKLQKKLLDALQKRIPQYQLWDLFFSEFIVS